MSRMLLTSLATALLGSLWASTAVGQPFIPKKPADLIPTKPGDLIPKLPSIPNPLQNETGFTGPTKVHFHYTIRNESRETVRFRLPTGKDYVLKPGDTGKYVFTGYKPNATVLVHNTGRVYQLQSGDHKFWLMRDRTVGFDMNYRTD